eukprot:Sdes_comp8827_c0_seq1m213
MERAETAPKSALARNCEKFVVEKHVNYLKDYGKTHSTYEYNISPHLRMSGLYWALTSLALCDKLALMDRKSVLEFVASCQNDDGGFGCILGADSHLLFTLSAVQILALYDAFDAVSVPNIIAYVTSLQLPDGSFTGDASCGEVDSRFVFCALACLSLLGALSAQVVQPCVRFIFACQNFDGGFGRIPGSESHAGQVYCCVAALSIAQCVASIDGAQLAWWLAERQLPCGGLNGRPEKLPDVCYSWWVLTSLKILDRVEWIDSAALGEFIFAAQDLQTGGISDRPGNMVDPFHTLFGIAGMSLLGDARLKEVDPVYCLPRETIQRLGL